MASEVESEALDSIDTSELKNIRSCSAFLTWEHTRLPGSNEPVRNKKARLLFYCKHCTELYAVQLTSNFRNHLALKHGITVKPETSHTKEVIRDQLKNLYFKASSQNKTKELDSEVLQAVLNKEVINEALITLIVVQNLPFRMVKWPEFHVFLQSINPEVDGHITIAHLAVSKKIYNLWLSQKDII